jgi:Curli production assembly/transport component CsgG/EF hand
VKKILILSLIIFFYSCSTASVDNDTPPVLNEVTEWADFNHDGLLQENELEDLYITAMFSLRGEHESESPIDPFIDRNNDSFIDQEEIELFAHTVFVLPVFNLYDRIPHIASIVDLNGNGEIEESEAGLAFSFMFEEDPELVEPGPVDHKIEEVFDKNGNGYFEQIEIDEGRAIFLLSFLIFAQLSNERIEVHTFLDELSDLNNDGYLDQGEIDLRQASLEEPHRVQNPLDERLDFNRNSMVEDFEIKEALQSDQQEISANSFLPVVTRVDWILDLNKDNFITEEEIRQILDSFMIGPGPVEGNRLFSDFFDVDKNGDVSETDLYMFRELIFRPHPVFTNSDFDMSLDGDGDNFISPEEIGVAAGYSPESDLISFDERLERMSWSLPESVMTIAENQEEMQKEDSNISADSRKGRSDAAIKKLEQISGKSLAVVNINVATSNVDSETASGIILFIENAFVNLGYASVMDRANLDSLLKEQNFELSSVVDEETALEAGKIAGLDFIVVGSVSFVGGRYYLNVKCLNVETSEIFGSSIAEVKEQSDFFEMSNVAVGKFF